MKALKTVAVALGITLAEFTRDDIAEMVSRGPALRTPREAPKPTTAG
jgi:hypothetical protein